MRKLFDIGTLLKDEDYERLQLNEKLLKEINEIDKSIAALTEKRQALFDQRHQVLVERSVLYETIQAFDKQFNAEGL